MFRGEYSVTHQLIYVSGVWKTPRMQKSTSHLYTLASANFKMKLYSLCVISMLWHGAFAAKASSPDKFQIYHSRSLSSTPLEIDDNTYENLTSAPRDYSIAVLLTAIEAKYGCKLCRDFAPEWELVAKSWTRGDKKGDSRMLFSTLDFSNGKNIFQKVLH
jgi:oligosaccharyltransferase complex subunit gamma